MPQTRSKSHPAKDQGHFSDDSVSLASIKLQKKNHQSLIIDEASDQSPRQMTQRIQSNPSEIAHETEVKQEPSSFVSSSFMDLEDIISDPQHEFNPQIYYDSDESQTAKHNKNKKIKKNKKKLQGTSLIPIKIQDQESPYSGDRQGRSKGNRKVRTTINEQKIKIMEYLFPFVANQQPYKGTILSLKDVGKIVDLGYSTILHKYKDYREKGQIEKGLLLKCKNFKRKYNKSLILENFIKRALKESEFKTAKQLASFISEHYHINANRSIISRHLNQMQRDKVKIEDKIVKVPGLRKHLFVDGQTLKKLKQFCLVYLGIKQQRVQFHYLTAIRLYLIENRVYQNLQEGERNFSIMDLIITATESQLKEYYMNFIDEKQVILEKYSQVYESTAYKALYNHLEIAVQNQYLDIQFENEEKAFIVYPFRNSKTQMEYRFKVLEELMDKRISILTVPPYFNVKNFNFIMQWFESEVLTEVKELQFESSIECREYILRLMNSNQGSLKIYANLMETTLKNF